MSNHRRLSRSWASTWILLACGFAAGWLGRAEPLAHADVRSVPPPPHLQSGGARSEVILQQIAASLERIEARLQRFEEMAAGRQPASGTGAKGAAR